MTTLIAQDTAYSAVDPCGYQTGLVACTGRPLLQAEGGNTRLFNGVISYEIAELLTPGRRDVDQAGSGVNCASRTIDDVIDGYNAILRNCGKIHPGLLAQWGVSEPVFSADGALIGSKGFKASSACRCGGAECTNGGFYLILWSKVYGCDDNEELVDDNGRPLYEVTVFPWIERFVPTTNSRRTGNLQDGRRDLRARLRTNKNFKYGPGMATPNVASNLYPTQPDDTDAANPVGICEPYVQFLTNIPFPGACACVNHARTWAPGDGDPVPVGEPGWTAPPDTPLV